MRFKLFLEQNPMGGPPMGDPMGGMGGGMGGPPPMGGDPMMGGMGGPPMGGGMDPMMGGMGGGMGGPPMGNQNPSLPKEKDVWSVLSSILKKSPSSPSAKPKKPLQSSHFMN